MGSQKLNTNFCNVLQIVQAEKRDYGEKKCVNYYPFGLKHKGYNNVISSNANSVAQKYKYNGKELNEELGLDWYDYGARNYDASLGRWMNLDPLTEFMYSDSPFNYAYNNPIYFTDAFGMFPQEHTGYYDWNGLVIFDPEVNSQSDLNDLGIGADATYIGDDYYDRDSSTYWDSNGNAHHNVDFNLACMCPTRSFSQWFENTFGNLKGYATYKIGSGIKIVGGGDNGLRSNTKSENPDEDITIDYEIIEALLLIAKKRGGRKGNRIEVFKNGMDDIDHVIKTNELVKRIIDEKTNRRGTVSTNNVTADDTTEYSIYYYKNGETSILAYGPRGKNEANKYKEKAEQSKKYDSVNAFKNDEQPNN